MIRLDEPAPALAARYHGGDLGARDVEAHPVLSRWSRAAGLGLRADAAAHPEGPTSADLADRRDRMDAVFREEMPLLSPIADELSARSMVAIVADRDGVVLVARGGGDFVGEAARVRLVEGSRWSEAIRGTNAIGTALAERRPLAVIGRAHYEERNHGLFCYATPIRDAYGDQVAVLDVTGALSQHSAAVGIAVQAAGVALERALRLRAYSAATAGGLTVVERMLHRTTSPALLIEASGEVLAMNGAARAALGIADHDGGRPLTPGHDGGRPQTPGHDGGRPQAPGHDGGRPQAPGHDGGRPQAPGHDGGRPQTPGHDGGHARNPGEGRTLTVERVFGTSMDALRAVALSPGGARFETARARYRLEVEPIVGAGGRTLSLVAYLSPIAPPVATPARVPQSPPGARSGPAAPARPRIHPAFDVVFGTDRELIAAKDMAARFAPTSLSILLLAETGTGKELFARAIHAAGGREGGAFVALNCGALAPSLLEAELFGYAPGAFTGAGRRGSDGKVGAASGGTLFLDEIAEMPESLQAVLLRVLEDGEYYRLGDSRPRRSSFRLVGATCCDLPALVAGGRFRRDLFFRVQGATVTIPPLRTRTDRLPLARDLLAKLAAGSGKPCPELADDALSWIATHPWPGNVRELKSALAHALVMAGDAPSIDRACFPRVLLSDPPPATGGVAGTRDALLRAAATEALRATGGNFSEAARRLGIARSTLYRMVGTKG